MKKVFKTAMAFVLYSTNTFATSDSLDSTLEAAPFCVRAITEHDAPLLQNIMDHCFQEGLPANAQSYTSNMMKRAQTGNPFTCYLFQDTTSTEATHAAVGFGRMPITDYKADEHADILNHFIDLGVLRKKDEQGGLEEDNLERIENRGLGVILPMLSLELSAQYKLCVLGKAKELFETLTNEGNALPIENTKPHQLIGLFHPDDPLVSLMTEAGFTATSKEGFEKFYNKPRIVLHATL